MIKPPRRPGVARTNRLSDEGLRRLAGRCASFVATEARDRVLLA